MGTVIREATAQDMDSVFAMAKDLATSFNVEYEAFCVSFHEVLHTSDACLLVAEKNKVVVAYLLGFEHAAFYANGRVSWVEEVYVNPHCRKEGLGRLLMDVFEKGAQQRSSRLVALSTRRAGDFYESLGYEASATYYKKTFGKESEIT
ncbi:GNAT family N-acetyltransferase [Mariprofundus ferrooxydans]|nr:GNAT family N-acetyltransferase [Mariprofundus ferrooxydans]